MAKVSEKLPFVNAIYKDIATGAKIQVTSRDRLRNGAVTINYRQDKTGAVGEIDSSKFYDKFKRMKEGTPFKVSGDWNE